MRRFLQNRFVYGLYLLIVVLLLFEVAVRVFFSFEIGPRVLAFGTSWYRNELGDRRREQIEQVFDREADDWLKDEDTFNTVYTHEDEKGGYLKFFPNEAKFHKDVDTGEVFPVTINGHGFRGKEFVVEKPEGVIRVLTLGASSTVGLWNRDDETYPYQLELLLNENCPGPQQFEVINFAIPHAVADQILAMFLTEGVALEPDVITFYEGRNDSYQLHPMDFFGGRTEVDGVEQGAGSRDNFWYELSQRLIVARLLDELLTNHARISAEKTNQILERVATRTSQEFLLDLDQLRQVAQRRGIVFIVANQQANSKSWFGLPEKERMKLKGVTYQDEVDQIRALLERGESISGYELNFLVHDRLMRDLEGWARRERLPFVDIIGLLDQERHHLVSWVHLDPYANRLVASAFADEILRHTCPEAGL